MTRNDYKIDNSGNNQGLIVAENKGNIEVSIKNAVRIPSLIDRKSTRLNSSHR